MLRILIPTVHTLITTQSIHPRAIDSKTLQMIAQKQGINGDSIPSIEDALKKALEKWTENSVIIATGSIFVAAAIRELWMTKYQKRMKKY